MMKRFFGRKEKRAFEEALVEAQLVEADRELRRVALREDLIVFAGSGAVRDEATHEPLQLAPYHEVWLRDLADPSLRRLALVAFPGSGKTTIESAFVAWLVLRAAAGLGSRPVIYAGPSERVAETFLSGVRKIAESDEALDAFPEARAIKWTSKSAEVPGAGRLPALVAIGPETRVLSRRGAVLIADDVQRGNDARSKDARERGEAWFFETLSTRILTPDSKIVVSAAPFDSADLVSTLARRSEWTVRVVRILDRSGLPTWPARFDLAAVEGLRAGTLPQVFARTYLLDPAAGDGRSLFSAEAIDASVAAGEGMACAERWSGETAVLACDPAFTQGGGDASGIVVVSIESDGRRRVVDCLELRLAPSDLAREVVRAARRYRPGIVALEANGAQAALISLVQALAPDLPTMAINTTRASKWGSNGKGGLPGLAQSVARGRWCLPSTRGPDGALVPAAHSKRLADCLLRTLADQDVHVDDVVIAMLLAEQAIAKREGYGWATVPHMVR